MLGSLTDSFPRRKSQRLSIVYESPAVAMNTCVITIIPMPFFGKTVQQATMVCIAYKAFWVTENKQLTAASTFTPGSETATCKDNLKTRQAMCV